MLLYEAEQRRRRHAKADLIEAVSSGYAGCKTDKRIAAKQRLLDLLRAD